MKLIYCSYLQYTGMIFKTLNVNMRETTINFEDNGDHTTATGVVTATEVDNTECIDAEVEAISIFK